MHHERSKEKLCQACGMRFDWQGTIEGGEEYCCAECARGLPCTCPQHDHQHETEASHLHAGPAGTR